MTPFFSIVIPTYNRSGSIRRTLDSVRHQTFTDFECVIVDDGSNDGDQLAEVVSGMNDGRFRLVRTKNGGGGAARNAGVNSSHGRFIAFLDSDDFFFPSKLDECRAAIERSEFNERETVLFSQIIVDRGCSRTWVKPSRSPRAEEPIDDYLIFQGGFIQTSTIVLSREIALRVPFDPILPFGQDTDFCIRLNAHGCRFEMLPEPLVVWDDTAAPNRVSGTRKVDALLAWTDRIRPLISDRCYYAYRGWHGAKAAYSSKQANLAARLYFDALLHGSFTPRLAVKAALQISLPSNTHRNLANMVVRLFGKKKKANP